MRVTGLYIYPVKSCRGISLSELKMTATGPENDRRWMLVDKDNKFITLRTHPQLSGIKTSIQGSFLHLYAGTNKILVDFSQDCEQTEPVTVWKDTFMAGIENKSINEALSDFLSQSVRLVRYQKQSHRDLGEAGSAAVKQTMFADSRPILLTNEASLADLNMRLCEQGKDPSAMERFRANIVIEGLPAYAEDAVQEWQIGNLTFINPKLCTRCPVITQDAETGKVVSKETLQTLADFRRVSGSSKIPFGVNLTPATLGMIRVGDSVRAVRTSPSD